MEQTKITEKSCLNCKYFNQYYFIRGSTLAKVNLGNCLKNNMTLSKMRKRLNCGLPCDNWEICGEENSGLHGDILQEIIRMQKKLRDIKLILELKSIY